METVRKGRLAPTRESAMGILVDSAEDELPEDVAEINRAVQEEHRSFVTEGPGYVFQKDWAFSEGRSHGLADGDEGTTRVLTMAAPSQPTPKTTYPLERWLVQAHTYSEEQAAKVGILGRLFSGDATRVRGGVIHDAKRFSIVDTENLRKVEVGVAVRLSVATSKVNAKVELTLPNLAAEAQLKNIDTRVGITVVGYKGPLGGLLPAPGKLDVETCAEYMEAFRKIQAVIFGEEGWRFVVPTTLSYDELVEGTALE